MFTLFIDTHETTLITLLKDLYPIDFVNNEDKRQSTKVMPLIMELLTRNNITTKDLSEVLVVNGPGSFTGVRIGMTIAKTLAYTLNIPIKTITSIEMLAIYDDFKNDSYGVLDTKGVYVGNVKNGLINCEYFLKNDVDFNNLVTDVTPDFTLIKKHFYLFKECFAKDANPIYIKKIEAIK